MQSDVAEQPTEPAATRIILIDQDNVRASAGWPNSRAFRDRLARTHSLDPRQAHTAMIIEVDERRHTSSKSADAPQRMRARQIGPQIVISFSGPRLRADDLIARDVEYFAGQPDVVDVLVVSSDKLVRRRCNEARGRASSQLRLRFETGEAFALLMPPESASRGGSTSTCTSGGGAAPNMASTPPSEVAAMVDEAVSDVTTPVASGLRVAVAEYAAWVEREQPQPQKSAQDVSMAGEKSRQGSKRKLGVRR